jgi:hypothetical protein
MYAGKAKFVSFRADFRHPTIDATGRHIANMCSTSRQRSALERSDAILEAMLRGQFATGLLASVLGLATSFAQQPQRSVDPETIPMTPPSVTKLGPGLFKIGEITVDTTKREASMAGKVNAVQLLEFVANTRGGLKAYESALTIDTNAVTFNAAMLLIGLDKEHARVPTAHFDPTPPRGDRVALWIDWTRGGDHVRTPVEELLFDNESRRTVPSSEWVYTGSSFVPQGPTPTSTRYVADIDGVLIGFVHSPAPIIENVAGPGVARYGSIVMNPNLGLEPDTPVVLTVKALGSAPKPH